MFERSVGKNPVPYIASSRTRTGGMHRREAGLRQMVERELVESHRDERGVADDVAEPRARDAGGALHVEAPDLRVLARRRRATAARRPGATRRRRPRSRRPARTRAGGFGTRASAASRSASAAASSSSACLSSALTGRSASSSSGVGLPLSFVCPRSSSTRGMSARQRSSASRSASNSSTRRPCARARRASARRRPSGLEVDHAGSLESVLGAGSAAGDRRDVRGDVGDLLLAERARERRHGALAVRHAVDDELRARLRVVEVRADLARAYPRRRACGSRRRPTRRGRPPCPRPDRPRRPACRRLVSVSSVSVVSVSSVSVVSVSVVSVSVRLRSVVVPSTVSGVAVPLLLAAAARRERTTPSTAARITSNEGGAAHLAIVHRCRTEPKHRLRRGQTPPQSLELERDEDLADPARRAR